MDPNLATTNMWLAIIAIVSVLEALVIIGLAVGGFMVYRRVMTLLSDLEARHIAPLRERVDAILGDVKSVTARVSEQTERVDHAISGTIDRVDETAERVRDSVRDRVTDVLGVIRGLRAALMSVLGNEGQPKPPAAAAGRV